MYFAHGAVKVVFFSIRDPGKGPSAVPVMREWMISADVSFNRRCFLLTAFDVSFN